jgi:hypothetical protein
MEVCMRFYCNKWNNISESVNIVVKGGIHMSFINSFSA